MPKKEMKEVRTSHVKELCDARGWDLPQFAREAYYQHGLSLNTSKKVYNNAGLPAHGVVIKLARLFGATEPYREILEIRLA